MAKEARIKEIIEMARRVVYLVDLYDEAEKVMAQGMDDAATDMMLKAFTRAQEFMDGTTLIHNTTAEGDE